MAAVPLPVREAVISGESGSFEITVRVAVFDPVDDGLKATVSVLLPPCGIIGVVLPQGFGPPFTFKVKSIPSDSNISYTSR